MSVCVDVIEKSSIAKRTTPIVALRTRFVHRNPLTVTVATPIMFASPIDIFVSSFAQFAPPGAQVLRTYQIHRMEHAAEPAIPLMFTSTVDGIRFTACLTIPFLKTITDLLIAVVQF